VAVPPGFSVPTFKAVQFCVQSLFEYTPTFMVVIVPLRGTVWYALSSPAVITVRSIPAIATAIMVPAEYF
jgi:hypothetical protein